MATHPECRAPDRDWMLEPGSNWERRGWSSGRVPNGTQQRVIPNSTPRSLGSNILLETPHQKRWAAI
jgi:hypothetical protein